MRNYTRLLPENFKQHMFWICFGYLLESPHRGDSNKYPKCMFYEEIAIKQGLSCISFWPLRILYNSIFILMATFFVNKGCHCNEGSL